jgi:hypothetical protein
VFAPAVVGGCPLCYELWAVAREERQRVEEAQLELLLLERATAEQLRRVGG